MMIGSDSGDVADVHSILLVLIDWFYALILYSVSNVVYSITEVIEAASGAAAVSGAAAAAAAAANVHHLMQGDASFDADEDLVHLSITCFVCAARTQQKHRGSKQKNFFVFMACDIRIRCGSRGGILEAGHE